MMPDMDALELVRSSLTKTALGDLDGIEKATGVAVATLIKIKYGTTKNPRYETVKVLAAHFETQARRKKRNGAPTRVIA